MAPAGVPGASELKDKSRCIEYRETMPCPMMKCEFCEHTVRKDGLTSHVKSQHVKELGILLLDDMKEYSVNTIQAYAAAHKTTSMPIPSKMYGGCEYWFGVRPYFHMGPEVREVDKSDRPDMKLEGYKEDNFLSTYLAEETNQEAHRRFIEEIFSQISMLDFIKYQKNLRFRHPDADVTIMRRELASLTEEHAALKTSTSSEIARLEAEVKGWKETADEKESITDLKKELQSFRSNASQLQKQNAYLKSVEDEKETKFREQWSELNMARMAETRKTEAYEDSMRKEIVDLKAKLEKAKSDVKKEAQKIVDKQNEAKKKLKEKKALEKNKQKKAAKKAKKLAELSDSDSDSSSDSDSD